MQLLANPTASHFSTSPENDSSIGGHGLDVEGKCHARYDLVGLALLDKEERLAVADKPRARLVRFLGVGIFGPSRWPEGPMLVRSQYNLGRLLWLVREGGRPSADQRGSLRPDRSQLRNRGLRFSFRGWLVRTAAQRERG
jgi:hypothetical protein